MNRSQSRVQALAIIFQIVLVSSVAGAQALSDDDLFQSGYNAYHHADYVGALKLLFAYQQRLPSPQDLSDPDFAKQVNAAISFSEGQVVQRLQERDQLGKQLASIQAGEGEGATVSGLTQSPPPLDRPVRPASIASEVTPTITVLSATYGLNCGAQAGNVTVPVAQSCSEKSDCTYVVDYRVLGDPVPGCQKDFRVTFVCNPAKTRKTVRAEPEAGFGTAISLACP